jgi:L-2,4-diaminobutyrate decarboxylase
VESELDKRTTGYEKTIEALWNERAVRKLARELGDIAADALTRRTGPVRRPGSASIATSLLSDKPKRVSVARVVREIQRASLQLAHPRYVAQQVSAPIPAAALVESVVGAMNQSLAVWEMSPVGTAVDRDLLDRFKKLFGYAGEAGGSMVPGGAFGNLTALLAAREALAPRASKTGVFRIAVIVGAQAHYSISRAAAILGMGKDAVFAVPMDREFRTDVARVPEAFAAARRAGYRKFILAGSSGSTPTGSFDDLEALHRIATEKGAWFHVDAAHGGGLAFSSRFRRRLNGLSRADSVAFDPHKMMFMPLSAGGVLVRDGAQLAKPLEEQAPYLFGSKRSWPDIGQLTLACSQRFDALKVWLVWRVYGPRIFEALVNRVCDVCANAFQYCTNSAVIEPLHSPHSNILCFRVRDSKGKGADRLHWDIKEELI